MITLRRGAAERSLSRTINDNERGLRLPHHPAYRRDNPRQPLLLECVEEIEVVHTGSHKGGVEEGKPLQVGQHHVVGLGEQGGHHHLTTGGGMVKSELIAQRGLTAAGEARDEVGAAGRQSTPKDHVETRDSRL